MSNPLPERSLIRRDLLIESAPNVCEAIAKEVSELKKLDAVVTSPSENNGRVRRSLLEREGSVLICIQK